MNILIDSTPPSTDDGGDYLSNNSAFLNSFTAISTSIILGIFFDTILVYYSVITIWLAAPVFSLWMGLFATAVGLTANGRVPVRRYSFYFLWAFTFVLIGLDWILLAYGVTPIKVFLISLVVALIYIYMNWGKSRRRIAVA